MGQEAREGMNEGVWGAIVPTAQPQGARAAGCALGTGPNSTAAPPRVFQAGSTSRCPCDAAQPLGTTGVMGTGHMHASQPCIARAAPAMGGLASSRLLSSSSSTGTPPVCAQVPSPWVCLHPLEYFTPLALTLLLLLPLLALLAHIYIYWSYSIRPACLCLCCSASATPLPT